MRRMAVTIPDTHLNILESKAVAHLATLGPDGSPQNNPIWFRWNGSEVQFSLTDGRQKYRNIKRNGHVALSITLPENPYHYIEIRGEVSSIVPDTDHAFLNATAQKYIGSDYPWSHLDGAQQRQVVSVTPVKLSLSIPI